MLWIAGTLGAKTNDLPELERLNPFGDYSDNDDAAKNAAQYKMKLASFCAGARTLPKTEPKVKGR